MRYAFGGVEAPGEEGGGAVVPGGEEGLADNNGTPSPDAHGILIQNIKDTTDDNTNVLSSFYEATNHGVTPNVYLYNIIISKLTRARKADSALDLFHAMKARGIVPTSVTYGALIAACGGVGDIASAENFFAGMASQRNFRPRIPPYNMMMQLYTQTKPDRERALYHYHEMLRTHTAPTAHTYKLLLDVRNGEVFEQLLADHDLTVNGAHRASLTHAYGCVPKDLDKAIAIFESIRDHLNTKRSGAALPDAVAFEALINVFNAVRRTDLIPRYVAKLDQYDIHLTAYVANLIIRGYAMHGDIEQARTAFDSLEDPPEGMAAPNNHTPHNSDQAVSVPANVPVFREEAMVRAELGNGNRDKALDLLERVKASPESDVELTILKPANFKDTIVKGVWFNEHFSPYCGHCHKFAPTWKQLVAKNQKQDDLAQVNCAVDEDLCRENNVDGHGKTEYTGSRKIENLKLFAEKISGPTPHMYAATSPTFYDRFNLKPGSSAVLALKNFDRTSPIGIYHLKASSTIKDLSNWLIRNCLPMFLELDSDMSQDIMFATLKPLVVITATFETKPSGASNQVRTVAAQ
ncbi:hypothetical protein BDY19DRAFT_998387 [Irpex rosettiformis]|uniref:Uncharacterized protein n=1 Tax=Irpex rosettiformis TaxID=378272 RepID=A0ACB8TNW9_9APHY|nr:hypothetical protein BDY19DRAFT_998387 [Irpex rosettiformis]